MFIRLRSAVVSVVLATLVCSVAVADSFYTTLTYDSGVNKVLGGSVSYITATPSLSCVSWDTIFIGYPMDTWDGTVDGYMYLCDQMLKYDYTAGVQGFITNPATSSRSLAGSSMAFAGPYASVGYSITSPASGNWLADADHYYGYTSEYCPAVYMYGDLFDPWNPWIALNECTPGPTESSVYYTSTSDSAMAP